MNQNGTQNRTGRGLTLVEMLIMALIALFIAMVLYQLFFGNLSLFAEKEAEQNIQRSIRWLFMRLSTDIKGTYRFEEIKPQKLVLLRFNNNPQLDNLADPSQTVSVCRVEYYYDAARKAIVRRFTDGEKERLDEFEAISPEFGFTGVAVFEEGKLVELVEEGVEERAIGVRLKVVASIEITSAKTETLMMTGTFRSRYRDRNERFGPLYRVDSEVAVPERIEHRVCNPNNFWKRDMGYFCSVDEDNRY